MCLLPDTHPEIHDAFIKGLFVVQRSNSKFSTMALDQSQEHSIRYLKEYGGSLGLYNDKKEKEVSEISRPELLRVIEEFESHLSGLTGNASEHKDVSQAAQAKLKRDVEALTILVERDQIINPFLEQNSDLITLKTGEIASSDTVKSIYEARSVGEDMFNTFIKDRVENCVTALTETIKKPKILTFASQPKINHPKKDSKLSSAKKSTALIMRLYHFVKA